MEPGGGTRVNLLACGGPSTIVRGMQRISLVLFLSLAGIISASAVPSPKLVVAIVVDQLRCDYLERFHDQFTTNGFRLLMERGAFMTAAHYDYQPTSTAPGHATILSGAPPAVHGVIGNDWFDKRARRARYCVEDTSVEGVGVKGASGQRSPKNFIGSNLADQMRLHFRSRVVGISMKDRGAILPAGKRPLGAYWFDSKSGGFATSTYYHPALPEWVSEFNGRGRVQELEKQTWERLLPESAYTWRDETEGEGTLGKEKKPTFPHRVVGDVTTSPFGNQLLIEFALAAVKGEKLGESDRPDLLCVSFSSNDYVGHRFGPHSQEVQDVTLRLDRQLNEFFNALHERIGLENVMIQLTADHGVAPNPEFALANGLDGGRLNEGELMLDLLTKLSARFGPGKFFLSPKFNDGQLFFDHDELAKLGLSEGSLGAFIREWALDTGSFHAVYTRGQLLEGRAPGRIGAKILNGFNGERSGDVIMVTKPFLIPSKAKSGTTHGSPWAYDSHVPVLFFGGAFVPGRYADTFNVTDIAPTLAAALRIVSPSGSIGNVFTPILR